MGNRRLVVALATLLSIVAGAAAAQDSTFGGDAQAGRAFALEVCTPCHVVSSRQLSPARLAVGPRFEAIANSPGVTAAGLRAFLATPHKTMPNLILAPDEAADVVAYLLSLRHQP